MRVALHPMRLKQLFHRPLLFFFFFCPRFLRRGWWSQPQVLLFPNFEAIRTIRMKKVQELRSKALDSYAYKWERTHAANELEEIYRNLGNGEELTGESDNVSTLEELWPAGAYIFNFEG